MTRFSMKRGVVNAGRVVDLAGIIDVVAPDLKAMLRPARRLQGGLLGLSGDVRPARDLNALSAISAFGGTSRVVDAEVYTEGSSIYAVAIREQRRLEFTGPAVGRNVSATPGMELWLYSVTSSSALDGFEAFSEAVSDSLEISLEDFGYRSEQFDNLIAEGRDLAVLPARTELVGAEVLRDRSARTLATAIKSSGGGLLVTDLERQLPSGDKQEVGTARRSIEDAGIVSSETVIICRRTQQQVVRVTDPGAVADMANRGVKCGCGRPFADERQEEALTITEIGRTLLDKSRWMSVLLLQELLTLGVSLERVLLEYTAGGDEVDCITDVSGEVLLFELKDKEFSLGQAYPFGAKMGLIRPRQPIIVTTEHVGGDAKDHFARAQQAGGPRSRLYRDPDDVDPVEYIEGLENLSRDLKRIISKVHRRDALRHLADLMPLAALEAGQVVDAVGVGDET